MVQNTPEHYRYALDVWTAIDQRKQMNRSLLFVSALALKQNDTKNSLALIAPLDNSFATTRFLRLAIYTQSGRFIDAFGTIRAAISFDRSGKAKHKPTIGKQLVILDAYDRSSWPQPLSDSCNCDAFVVNNLSNSI